MKLSERQEKVLAIFMAHFEEANKRELARWGKPLSKLRVDDLAGFTRASVDALAKRGMLTVSRNTLEHREVRGWRRADRVTRETVVNAAPTDAAWLWWARRKLAALPQEKRCGPFCKGWFTNVSSGEAEACDMCWKGHKSPLTDEEAALVRAGKS